MTSPLKALVSPASIAILGASPEFNKINGRPLKHLLDKGYAGRIYPVNPKYPEIAKLPCYPSVGAIPGQVDLAIIALPAKAVVDGLCERGVTELEVREGPDDPFFGAPVPQSDHARRAVQAAIQIQEAQEALNRERSARGLPTLLVRIAIQSGPVMVGDVGLTAHREFAAMGDTTNVAARIEKLTRDFSAQVLVSGATARHLGEEFILRELGSTEIRGRRSPVELYQVVGIRQELE